MGLTYAVGQKMPFFLYLDLIRMRLEITMAQDGHSPVLVFDSLVMVLHSLVLVFTQSSFNFYRVQF